MTKNLPTCQLLWATDSVFNTKNNRLGGCGGMSPIDSGMGIFNPQFGVTAWGGGALLKEGHLQVRLEGSEPLAILELGKQEPQLHSERLSQKTKR